jgi:hypothetical protein
VVYLLLVYFAVVGVQLTFGGFDRPQLVIGVVLLVWVATAARALRRRPEWPRRPAAG